MAFHWSFNLEFEELSPEFSGVTARGDSQQGDVTACYQGVTFTLVIVRIFHLPRTPQFCSLPALYRAMVIIYSDYPSGGCHD